MMIQFQIPVTRGENFTPASLMKRYAACTPGVEFCRSYFGNALLQMQISGKAYSYHHWSIAAVNGAEVVTLHCEEV